jgi:hypothetical protein
MRKIRPVKYFLFIEHKSITLIFGSSLKANRRNLLKSNHRTV